ncbi:MBL fold metallo-hydrolase [Microcella alkalica]|uniref:L-ascorbate metabolism protein UlaG (Beta-lactamase superfamily) n=1 Tax=Microcella alkalica TaxID=355930 RepID=A0A839E8Z7_9MICO|nr:MBL fold metallo-hydrolase [Microcella alkalica]MBA8847957.1 L-ascorbate metabolism protein UlaG (beta-lactamase superfamily) [Microcella alkalica]
MSLPSDSSASPSPRPGSPAASDQGSRSGSPTGSPIAVTVVGGPTALLEWTGLRLLLDPTFDPPTVYGPGPNDLTKTEGPAVAAADLGRIDVALVSHHHHEDNLDEAGRALALGLPLVITTSAGARELAARCDSGEGTATVIGLEEGESLALDSAALVGSAVAAHAPAGARVIAVTAQHGPPEVAERLGPVIGFVLSAPGEPTVFVSGDNSSVEVVRAIAARHNALDVAVLFAGAARIPAIDAALTLTAADARAAALALGARRVVGLHVDQWAHFSEGRDALEREFAELESAAGGPLLAATPLGERTELAV